MKTKLALIAIIILAAVTPAPANIYVYGPGFTGIIPSTTHNYGIFFGTQAAARAGYARLLATYSRRK